MSKRINTYVAPNLAHLMAKLHEIETYGQPKVEPHVLRANRWQILLLQARPKRLKLNYLQDDV